MSTEIITPAVSEIISSMVETVLDSEFNGDYNNAIENSGYDLSDRGAKMRIRNAIQSRANSALRDGKFDTAKVMAELHNAFKNARNNAPEIDPVDELRMVIRNTAYVLREMVTGNVSPDGIESIDLSDEFGFEFDEFDSAFNLSDAEFNTESALRFVPKRIARNGKQNDVGPMIEKAMAEFPVNEFVRVAQIRNKIAEMGLAETNSEWDGRISARLFPTGEFTLSDSIKPCHHFAIGNGQTRNGAMRVK